MLASRPPRPVSAPEGTPAHAGAGSAPEPARTGAASPETSASPGAAGVDEVDALVQPIAALEAVVASWDASQALTVQALKRAIEDLHKQALQRMIRALKDDPAAGARLRQVLGDPVVYAVLHYHGLLRAPLEQRLQQALDEVRPALASHGGGVELVAVVPPDAVEIRLIGACHGCPASAQTLSAGVEQAIRAHCPEIRHVRQVQRAAPAAHAVPGEGNAGVNFISPFAAHQHTGWLDAGLVDEVPEGGVGERVLNGRSVLLHRSGTRLSCVDNSCAHLGLPLLHGLVDEGTITCPFHGFRYLLETGECLTAPEVQLKVHAVRVSGTRVQVRLED